MKREFRGKAFNTKQGLFFGSEVSNPVGYLRSGGKGISYGRSSEPNPEPLLSRPHYILVMLLENSSAIYHDESGFTCPLSYGDFLLVFPGFRQRYGPGRGDFWGELNIGFTGTLFDLYREWGVLSPERAVWQLKDPAPWITRLERILEAPRPTTPYALARETATFAAFLMELLENSSPKQPTEALNDWFVYACIMLTNNLSEKVDLHSIAEEVGMGYDSFRNRFTRRAGMPPLRYRNQKRIQVACDLLRNTNKPVAEIAFYLGFHDDRHLAAFLKRNTGISPRGYRSGKTTSDCSS